MTAIPTGAASLVPQDLAIPSWAAVAAIVGVFIALTLLIATALGVFNRTESEADLVLRRLQVFKVGGPAPTRIATEEQTTKVSQRTMARSAVNLVGRVVQRRDFAEAIDVRLESAGLPIRTAEWLLLHVGCAVGVALVFGLLTSLSAAATVFGLVIGFIAPWIFLSIRQSRREGAFLAQLPDTLQLLAGSLQAGYSLPQAMDSVTREAKAPISVEFNRALIETRLGLPAEEALDGIAARTHSRDFSWIVMAIRIQREVGGNLAELLGTVAETLRERERLHRQIRTLSAEGRLSAVILAALPFVFTGYLMLKQPTYLSPLFHTRLGLLFSVTGVVLLLVGIEWMRRAIKVVV
jgi:tight adherence protein B